MPQPDSLSMPPDEQRQWFALYTATNNEKRVEQHLRTKEMETFLPVYTVTRRWKNRVTTNIEFPLFSGYVFARFSPNESGRVLGVPMVYSIVGNGKQAIPLPDAEIEGLRAGIHARRIDPYPYLTVGNRARIVSGPFAGLEGIVVRKDDHLRVVLTIDLIQRSIAVHVEAHELQACG